MMSKILYNDSRFNNHSYGAVVLGITYDDINCENFISDHLSIQKFGIIRSKKYSIIKNFRRC